MTINRAASYSAVYALARIAADAADHWVQTDHQAQHKAKPGAEGHKALAGHVGSYVATQGAALLIGNRVLGLGLRPRSMAAALALSGAAHYVIDRRWPLRKLAEATGKGNFYNLGSDLVSTTTDEDGITGKTIGTGAYALDQAAHHVTDGLLAFVAILGVRN